MWDGTPIVEPKEASYALIARRPCSRTVCCSRTQQWLAMFACVRDNGYAFVADHGILTEVPWRSVGASMMATGSLETGRMAKWPLCGNHEKIVTVIHGYRVSVAFSEVATMRDMSDAECGGDDSTCATVLAVVRTVDARVMSLSCCVGVCATPIMVGPH